MVKLGRKTMKKLVVAVCAFVGLSGAAMAMEMPFTATITGQASGFISPGDVMNNGMVYAGTMDGVVPYFVTRCDYGYNWNPDTDVCDGTRGALAYQTTLVYVGTTSTSDGVGNTATLAARGDAPAASYCANLAPPDVNSHGYSDWYLPSQEELVFMGGNSGAIGNFLASNYYLASTEVATQNARVVRFPGTLSYDTKTLGHLIRCMRKGN